MRLFHILSRHVAEGKIKVTKKLLARLHRETGGKYGSKTSKPGGGRHHGIIWFLCSALMVVVLTLTASLVTGRAAASANPGEIPSPVGGYSAPALYDQANAYARAGKIGMAILDYERARLLAPNNADIAANLHFVRAQAGLPDVPENWFIRSLAFASPNTTAWLGSFGLLLACVSVLILRLHPRWRLAMRSLTFAGLLLAAAAIASAITIWPTVNEAVVIAREAPACTSPVPAAESLFQLREGETVTVRAEQQGFALVQTSAGRSGWVARIDLARVVPQSGNAPPSTNRT